MSVSAPGVVIGFFPMPVPLITCPRTELLDEQDLKHETPLMVYGPGHSPRLTTRFFVNEMLMAEQI